MNADRIFNLLGAIVTVALVTTAVTHKETARIVSAGGNALTNFLGQAMGQRRR